MAQEVINIGVQADDGTGDTIRGAGIKINNNFTELYAQPLAATTLGLFQNEISTTESNADIVLKPSGTGAIPRRPACKYMPVPPMIIGTCPAARTDAMAVAA